MSREIALALNETDEFEIDTLSTEAATQVPTEPQEPRERIFKDTRAYKALSKIGVVNENGLIKNPSYILAQEFGSNGEVVRAVVYRITYVSAYDVDMSYVENGQVVPTGITGTNNDFWDQRAFSRSTEAEWKKG